MCNGGNMKIYLASSWKNDKKVKEWQYELKKIGHEVDAFCNDSDGRYVFHFSEIGDPRTLDAISFLEDGRTQKAFKEDKKWIDWCDCVILILPAGKSSHLEAGYAKGKGKLLVIYQAMFPLGEFDVMYGFADIVTESTAAVLDFLNSKDVKR